MSRPDLEERGVAPFTSVLVANRGEIACRIIRTLDRMGIESVAIHSDADHAAEHVTMATRAVRVGAAPAAESYLRLDAIVDAAVESGAQAIHPGYGLLSESAEFAERCSDAGVVFIGPTPQQLRQFGLKHEARELAEAAGVALVPGSGLLASADEARVAADAVGYPVMLKASAGGGGIGMRRCDDPDALTEAFESVQRVARNSFGDSALFVERFVERARHVEVQIFGDGQGNVIDLGDRDCSAQRRNQKVVEEAPAPGIPERLRDRLLADARRLASSVDYRSAGTVEFVVDADSLGRDDGGDAWFLEVNTRLQVEHGVTEMTHGIDLVEWMVQLAAGTVPAGFLDPPTASGCSMEVRIYAENPLADFAPSPGVITALSFPSDVRCDGWVSVGTEVSPYYDPLLAKLIVHEPTREAARRAIERAVRHTRVDGIATNVDFLVDVVASGDFVDGATTTGTIDRLDHRPRAISVHDGGLFTTVQDLPGRLGYWHVGVPPSGPMDDRSFALANELLGNDRSAPAIEITLSGPTIEFHCPTAFVLGGADIAATLDGQPVAAWTVVEASPGSILATGQIDGPGSRCVLAIEGGVDVAPHLGSASTFVLGGFGGHAGRALRAGDVLALRAPLGRAEIGTTVPASERPMMSRHWEIGVLSGPHAAPDYFTRSDIEMFYDTDWEVHFNSDRTGVRLVGPKPEWARPDGGEAGLHPSNIHDNPYAVGTVDFTGDMPIILGRDGPSLGGFVCPATVATGEFWKVGQLRAGDTLRFVPVDEPAALAADPLAERLDGPVDPVLSRTPATAERPALTIRRDGDSHVLVEYGDNVLDLGLRLRAGALMTALDVADHPLTEIVPGIRSIQVGFDPRRIDVRRVVELIEETDRSLGPIDQLEVPSRVVRLPLSWDDPATRLATEKYMQTVRADAPWCPWNIEFIRRVNGLETVDEVKEIVFDASYLVLGLGDVYLGAPVATPVDPRHRLVTTKYNPARTWTAENSVGIGGAYLCIYGMEGPGGYQFVGRTVQVWDRWRSGTATGFEQPWLLRYFDQIKWYEVSADELLDIRAEVAAGRHRFDIEETTFSLADHNELISTCREEIDAFAASRDAAFELERGRWADSDLTSSVEATAAAPVAERAPLLPGQVEVQAMAPGVVWQVSVEPGASVEASDTVAIVEAMKMETSIAAGVDGTVVEISCEVGEVVKPGQTIAVIQRREDNT